VWVAGLFILNIEVCWRQWCRIMHVLAKHLYRTFSTYIIQYNAFASMYGHATSHGVIDYTFLYNMVTYECVIIYIFMHISSYFSPNLQYVFLHWLHDCNNSVGVTRFTTPASDDMLQSWCSFFFFCVSFYERAAG